MKKYVSASQIHQWAFCPTAYHLKYDLGLVGQVGSPAKIGKTFHDRIAQSLPKKEDPRIPKKWLNNYRLILNKLNLSDNLLIELIVEEKINGRAVLGFIDVLDLDRALVVDWKFSKRASKYNVQGYIYKELVRKLYGLDCQVAFCFVPLLQIKPMHPEDFQAGEEQFNSFLCRDKDNDGHFSPSSRKCRSCGYYLYCSNPDLVQQVES